VHDLSAGGQVLDRVRECAERALTAYPVSAETRVDLLNVSENATFLVTSPDEGRSVLRVHRLGYHSEAEIASELAWMDALRAEAGVRTPRVLAATDGRRIVSVADSAAGVVRRCVRFEFLPGVEPGIADATTGAHFEELGRITARMHRHARQWRRPAGFTRFRWDYDAAFGREARWGRWQRGIGVGAEERELLGRLDATLRRRLAGYGSGPERYGLVHADTRLANLLVDDDGVSVIDFDDSGFSWYLYDLGTTVSFAEHSPRVPELIDSWLTGYRREGGALTAADEAEIWTFIMYRRLLLLAWIGTHQAAGIAAELGPEYTAGSCALAERYLSRLPGIGAQQAVDHAIAPRTVPPADATLDTFPGEARLGEGLLLGDVPGLGSGPDAVHGGVREKIVRQQPLGLRAVALPARLGDQGDAYLPAVRGGRGLMAAPVHHAQEQAAAEVLDDQRSAIRADQPVLVPAATPPAQVVPAEPAELAGHAGGLQEPVELRDVVFAHRAQHRGISHGSWRPSSARRSWRPPWRPGW
jgi:Ser/Thr protein kinase RdoA (MazF antagonist)